MKDYKLTTVTYGTSSVSFLTTCCVSQVAEVVQDISMKRITLKDFYVDDLISDGHLEEQCYDMHIQLQAMIGNAGFLLRKWCFSSRAIMSHILNAQEDLNYMVNITEESVISALGLLWQLSTDNFCFIMKNWSHQLL